MKWLNVCLFIQICFVFILQCGHLTYHAYDLHNIALHNKEIRESSLYLYKINMSIPLYDDKHEASLLDLPLIKGCFL